MANFTGTNNRYNHVTERAGDGGIDFDNDSFEMGLLAVGYTPNLEHVNNASLTNEIAATGGYARQSLTGVSWVRAAGQTTLDANPVVFSAAGADFAAARYWFIRDVTADLLIAYGLIDDTPADVVVTDGNSLTITPNASGLLAVG